MPYPAEVSSNSLKKYLLILFNKLLVKISKYLIYLSCLQHSVRLSFPSLIFLSSVKLLRLGTEYEYDLRCFIYFEHKKPY